MTKDKNTTDPPISLKPMLGDGFGCHLFKFENVAELLLQIDDRIDIMEKCSDDLTRIKGINLIEI